MSKNTNESLPTIYYLSFQTLAVTYFVLFVERIHNEMVPTARKQDQKNDEWRVRAGFVSCGRPVPEPFLFLKKEAQMWQSFKNWFLLVAWPELHLTNCCTHFPGEKFPGDFFPHPKNRRYLNTRSCAWSPKLQPSGTISFMLVAIHKPVLYNNLQFLLNEYILRGRKIEIESKDPFISRYGSK